MPFFPFMNSYKADKDYQELYELFLHDEYEQVEKQSVYLFKKYPDHKKTMELLAQIAWNQWHYQRARERYNKLLTSHPGDSWARLWRAKCFFALYKFEDALVDYMHLYEHSFWNAEFLLSIADTYQKLNLQVLALHYYEQCVEKAPSMIKAHVWLGYQYIILGHYADAQKHAEIAKDLYYKNKKEYDTNTVDNIFELEGQIDLLLRKKTNTI